MAGPKRGHGDIGVDPQQQQEQQEQHQKKRAKAAAPPTSTALDKDEATELAELHNDSSSNGGIKSNIQLPRTPSAAAAPAANEVVVASDNSNEANLAEHVNEEGETCS